MVLRNEPSVRNIDINSTLGSRYVEKEKPAIPPERQTVINGEKRGRALIICNTFEGSDDVRDWKPELKNAKNVLQGRLGLDVDVKYDQTMEKMIEEISNFSGSQEHGSVVALAVLSHGTDRNICCADLKACTVQQVVDALCTTQLRKAPKVVLLSFCRGKIGKPRRNRTEESWVLSKTKGREESYLPMRNYSSSGGIVTNGLSQTEKRDEWKRCLFPTVEVPENCYICYSTLPDSLSLPGIMFEVLSDHLTEICKDFRAANKPIDHRVVLPFNSNSFNDLGTDSIGLGSSTGKDDLPPDVRPKIWQGNQANSEAKKQTLPRVELISLLTDVSYLVRDKSGFTQYMNICYRLKRKTKDVVIEILPLEGDE